MRYQQVQVLVIVSVFASLAAGCDMKRLVINTGYLMVEEAVASFFEESDTVLAAQAAPANLKLIEGMARGSPENTEIQLAASQMLSMYAFGFLDDCCADEEEQEKANQRARGLYLRAREYAVRALLEHADFRGMMEMNLEGFKQGLELFDEEQAPALFWATFAWGLYINVSRNDVSAVADLSKVAALAERVAQLEESYFYGGAHLFLMVYYGSTGKALGGDPEKAKDAYERAWKLGGEKFLMTKYLFAKYYCRQILDRELFDKLLGEIIAAPDDLLPEQRLSNTLAKEKAARLKEKADEIF